MKDVAKIKAAVLIAHGGNDFNVMTKNAAQLYAALKAQGTSRTMFYFHQGGHGGAPPDFDDSTCWFTQVPVGPGQRRREPAEVLGRARGGDVPAARRPRSPATRRTPTTLTVAAAAPFRVGYDADDPADQRHRHDHEHDARDHEHRRQHA